MFRLVRGELWWFSKWFQKKLAKKTIYGWKLANHNRYAVFFHITNGGWIKEPKRTGRNLRIRRGEFQRFGASPVELFNVKNRLISARPLIAFIKVGHLLVFPILIGIVEEAASSLGKVNKIKQEVSTVLRQVCDYYMGRLEYNLHQTQMSCTNPNYCLFQFQNLILVCFSYPSS